MKPVDTMPAKPRRIEDGDLRRLFLDARTHNAWLDRPVPDAVLAEIYEIAKFGPTSMNTQPMRLTFLRTAVAKERLRPYLGPANVDKTMAAPVTAIVAHDLAFHEHLPKLFPHNPNAKGVFEGKPALIETTAFRNGSRGPTSSSPRVRLDWIAGRCPALTMPGWTSSSLPARSSGPISCATLAMAIMQRFSRVHHATISRPSAHFFEDPQSMKE
jgi:nitroreductase